MLQFTSEKLKTKGHWHDNIKSVFVEMKRIVRPGGILIILETLGTGTEEPDPPEFLIKYYKRPKHLHDSFSATTWPIESRNRV